MSQSFWSNEKYLGFVRYTEKLEKEHMKMSESDLKAAVRNWKKGVEKMTQLAIGYDVNFEPPEPSFLTYSEKDAVKWVVLHKLDDFKIGLWDGPCRTIDGHPVFDPGYLGFADADLAKIDEMAFTDATVAFLNVMKQFDGVVIPEAQDLF